MKIETELKFPVAGFKAAADRLNQMGAEASPWYFEKNIVLDDKDGSLRNKDCLLRLRQGLKNKLTLKLPPVYQDKTGIAKTKQEYETCLDNIEDMEHILVHLGYQIWLRYEKFRQVWKLPDVKVCLDILPFGRFVEIEGSEKSIMQVSESIGLDMKTATAQTYHELNQACIKDQKLHPTDDFVFDASRQKYICRELNIHLSVDVPKE